MIGSISNIYVSVTGPRESEHHKGYRRAQHIWLISVESHHTHIPGTAHNAPKPIHYTAVQDNARGAYSLQPHSVADGPHIIGTIVLTESAHTSPDKIREYLEADLKPNSTVPKGNDTSVSEDEPEHWLRRALHSLQHRGLAESFDIDSFMLFAHSYLANRLEGDGPVIIAYPRHKKAGSHSSWTSNPVGGLMPKKHEKDAQHA